MLHGLDKRTSLFTISCNMAGLITQEALPLVFLHARLSAILGSVHLTIAVDALHVRAVSGWRTRAGALADLETPKRPGASGRPRGAAPASPRRTYLFVTKALISAACTSGARPRAMISARPVLVSTSSSSAAVSCSSSCSTPQYASTRFSAPLLCRL